jgi:hypothetical protein
MLAPAAANHQNLHPINLSKYSIRTIVALQKRVNLPRFSVAGQIPVTVLIGASGESASREQVKVYLFAKITSECFSEIR